MIKVDHVFVNRLEQLAKIELDANEREKLRLEIIRALAFIGTLDAHEDDTSVGEVDHPMPFCQLRRDQASKTLFDLFTNVPDQVEEYVVVSVE